MAGVAVSLRGDDVVVSAGLSACLTAGDQRSFDPWESTTAAGRVGTWNQCRSVGFWWKAAVAACPVWSRDLIWYSVFNAVVVGVV